MQYNQELRVSSNSEASVETIKLTKQIVILIFTQL